MYIVSPGEAVTETTMPSPKCTSSSVSTPSYITPFSLHAVRSEHVPEC